MRGKKRSDRRKAGKRGKWKKSYKDNDKALDDGVFSHQVSGGHARPVVAGLHAGQLAQLPLVLDRLRREEARHQVILQADRVLALTGLADLILEAKLCLVTSSVQINKDIQVRAVDARSNYRRFYRQI